jgi:hypothetical protein
MGEFGAVSGHRDLHDSEGSLTSMISGSRLPLGYETGRFHLLGLGVYVKLEFSMITHFCGLNLHGGTPPIAPEGAKVEPHAYRLMFVCYPPSSMLGNLNQVTPLASLPKGVPLNLGPEITSFVYVLRYDIVTLILTPPPGTLLNKKYALIMHAGLLMAVLLWIDSLTSNTYHV